MTEGPSTPTAPPPRKRYLAAAIAFLVVALVIFRRHEVAAFYGCTQSYVWQQKCMNVAIRADQIVYADGPDADDASLFTPEALLQFQRWSGNSKERRQATLFLGPLETAPRNRRLVAISASSFGSAARGSARSVIVSAQTFVPGTPFQRATASARQQVLALNPSPADRIAIFAGQRDPHDPSRFVIRYTLSDRPGELSGRLNGDGSVSLTQHAP